jgi:hypothetical protein
MRCFLIGVDKFLDFGFIQCMEMLIRIKNEQKAIHLFSVLKELSYVEIESSPKKKPSGKKKVVSEKDFENLFGIWANRDITLKEIREKAWKRKI